jgi:DNA polymerase-4
VFVSTAAKETTILHADLDAFFASVEQRDNPALLGRPTIVGTWVVMAASYEARACGVHSAMGGHQARRLCPDATFVPPRVSAYSDASKAVFDVFDATSPSVEGISIDEAFIDVRGMERIAGSPTEIARTLRSEVRERVGLPITVGVASTKFLAKVASAVAKPDGLLVVPAGTELEFLHPLAVERLWGVGPVTSEKLRKRGLVTVGQVAQLAEAALVEMLGPAAGRHLHSLAHNRDHRRVRSRRRRCSIGSQRALGRMRRSRRELDAILVGIVDRLARRLRSARRTCRTVTLRLRFSDFSRATRSRTISAPTTHTRTIVATARELLAAAMPLVERRGITLLGIALSNLEDHGPVQLQLPLGSRRPIGLDAALDDIQDRFGSNAITRAVLLGRDQGPAVPLLPD